MKTLKDCPKSPNCVSTQTDQSDKKMEPIAFQGDTSRAVQAIKSVIQALPQAELVNESRDELHFTFKSKWLRFVDDVNFLIDPSQGLIHFRSASRTGYGDLGVNRKRMEDLTGKISAALK